MVSCSLRWTFNQHEIELKSIRAFIDLKAFHLFFFREYSCLWCCFAVLQLSAAPFHTNPTKPLVNMIGTEGKIDVGDPLSTFIIYADLAHKMCPLTGFRFPKDNQDGPVGSN